MSRSATTACTWLSDWHSGRLSGAPAQTVGAAWQATPASILKSSLRTVALRPGEYRRRTGIPRAPGAPRRRIRMRNVKVETLAPARVGGAPRQPIERGRVGAASSLSAR